MKPIDRAFTALNLKMYNNTNLLDKLAPLELKLSEEVQKYENYGVLRMNIRRPYEHFKLPEELHWTFPLIKMADDHQKSMGVSHGFAYLTVRHGTKQPKTNDDWHVDGFSMRISHIPEQNYLWTDVYPTEYTICPIWFPDEFDPLKHNIHTYLQQNVYNGNIFTMEPKTVYCLDPYIIHKRPIVPEGTRRTFIRVSFTPIEIMDDHNTINPCYPSWMQRYDRYGVMEFRDKLISYPG